MSAPTLGIIAGNGRLPAQLVAACRATGRACFVLAFEESAVHDTTLHAPHAVVRLGAVGEALERLRAAGVREVVLAGGIKRPSLASLRPDMAATRLLARLGKAFFGGDDALLKALIAFLEEEEFTVISAQDILQSLVAEDGVYGRITPTTQHHADIAKGITVAKQLGALDIGQAAIVENGAVLGVEAAEGTAALIARCASLRREPVRSGVLVKAKKPGQDERADLPAIGVDTVEAIHAAGFSGIAVEAGGSLILERERTIARANDLGVFLMGIRHDG